MALTLAEIEAEYVAALEDAEIDRERTRLYLATNMGTENLGAVWHRPGVDLVVDEQFPEASQLADANSAQHRDLHRIGVPARASDAPTLAALLRHELEHARQYDALGEQFLNLQDFLEDDILPYRAGGLDGCAGGLINSVPTEVDCNAAASVYVTERFSSEEVGTLRDGRFRHLACSIVGPEPFETIPSRMIAFAFVHRSCVERFAAENHQTVEEVLEARFTGASGLWHRLENGISRSQGG